MKHSLNSPITVILHTRKMTRTGKFMITVLKQMPWKSLLYLRADDTNLLNAYPYIADTQAFI